MARTDYSEQAGSQADLLRIPSPCAGMAADTMCHPALYQADEPLLHAINAAVAQEKPLLLSGEPGCGKSEVANFMAYNMSLGTTSTLPGQQTSLRFDMKSTTTARSLFYSYDVFDIFSQKHHKLKQAEKRRGWGFSSFITLNALGIAIADAAAWSDVQDLCFANYQRADVEPRRRVVLIDDIDRVPRHAINDILTELERIDFCIPLLDKTLTAGRRHRPILVITTNNERPLPDTFLHRCVCYSIPFPERDLLTRIVEARIPVLSSSSCLTNDTLYLLETLRKLPLTKRPGIAEFLTFITVLLHEGYLPDKPLPFSGGSWENLARVTLLKTAHDAKQFNEPGDLGKLLRNRSEIPAQLQDGNDCGGQLGRP